MEELIEVKTAELSGAALDWAVAIAAEAWKSAHTLYPTMTLDPSFSGVEARPYPRGKFGSSLMTCVLVPNNPFRQDPQAFCPSIEWSHGGPLIKEYAIGFVGHDADNWLAFFAPEDKAHEGIGSTHLIAACRAIVAAKLGDSVMVPRELVAT